MINEKEQGEIYLITNKINNKKYVGQTVSRLSSGRKYGIKHRWSKHVRDAKNFVDDCKAFCNAIRKYGKDNFLVEILLICNIKDLDDYETKFIKLYNTVSPNGYNIESGGKKNKIMHEETKDKLSKQHRFLAISEDNKTKIFMAMKELNITEIPMGINFTSNIKTNTIGFLVKKNNDSNKCFTSKYKNLTENLDIALQYFKYIKEENITKVLEIENMYDEHIKKAIRFQRISDDFKKILDNLKLNIDDIPLHIFYEKRSNRFYVNIPNKGCKYFTKNNPEKSLLESIKYINNL